MRYWKTGASSPQPASRAHSGRVDGLGGGLDLDAVDQQHIDNLEGVVPFLHDDTATALREGNEICVWHFDRAPIHQMQDERLKRLLVQNLANGDGIHPLSLGDRSFRVKYGVQT